MEEQKAPLPASPLATLGMIFTVLAMLTWGVSIGLISGDGILGVGIISLATVPSYLVAATNLLKTGDGFNGNVFSIFCCFFAAVAGVSNIMTWLNLTYGIPFPAEIGGIIWLFVGLELGICLLGLKQAPAIGFIQVAMATMGLLLNGLVGLGIIGAEGGVVSGWLFFFVALIQLYLTGAEHVSHSGVALPLGRPLFKAKEQK